MHIHVLYNMRFLCGDFYKELQLTDFMSFNDTCPLIYEIEICQSKKLKLPKFCPSNAINYRIPGNICVALFSQISRILLSHEIKFRECIAIPHLLYCPRESFAKIIFTKLLKSPFLQKFSDVKISQYTVYSIVIIIIY